MLHMQFLCNAPAVCPNLCMFVLIDTLCVNNPRKGSCSLQLCGYISVFVIRQKKVHFNFVVPFSIMVINKEKDSCSYGAFQSSLSQFQVISSFLDKFHVAILPLFAEYIVLWSPVLTVIEVLNSFQV